MDIDAWVGRIATLDDRGELARALDLDPALATQASVAEGRTLLHEACWHKKLPLVELLLSRGADPNARESVHGRSVLHCAVHDAPSGEVRPIVSVLLAHGASPAVTDAHGFTVEAYARQEIWDDPTEILALLAAAR
jgi:hypothetical protein